MSFTCCQWRLPVTLFLSIQSITQWWILPSPKLCSFKTSGLHSKFGKQRFDKKKNTNRNYCGKYLLESDQHFKGTLYYNKFYVIALMNPSWMLLEKGSLFIKLKVCILVHPRESFQLFKSFVNFCFTNENSAFKLCL